MTRPLTLTERVVLRFSPADLGRIRRLSDASVDSCAELLRYWVLDRLAAEEAKAVERRIAKVKQMGCAE